MAFDFDEWFKQIFRRNESPEIVPTSCLRPQQSMDLRDTPEAQLIELSRDYNGRVREAAVRELARFKTDAVFQTLIERLNDWVPQVRSAAQTSLESFFQPVCAGMILRGLGGILALQRRCRVDHSPYLQRFAELLRTPAARDLILVNVPACSGSEARYLLDLLTGDGSEMGEESLQVFARHRDCAVRLMVVRLCKAQPERHRAFLELFRQDSHPRVRGEVLCLQWLLCDEEARAVLLRSALQDRAGSVREVAIWFARKSGFDLRAFAEHALAENPTGNGAKVSRLGLLTVLKTEGAVDLARSEFESDCAAVRGAALACLVTLNRDASDTYVARALTDPSNKVARLARAMISRGQVALTHAQFIEAIRTLLSSGDDDRVFPICSLMSIWGRLEGLLTFLQTTQNAASVQHCIAELIIWERRQGCSAVRLDATERIRLHRLLEDRRVRDALSKVRSLVFALQTNGLWN